MSTYRRPPVKRKKRKKYQLQNPKRFLGFLIVLAVLIVALILLVRSCASSSQPEGENGNQTAGQESSNTSQQAGTSSSTGEIARQTVGWTSGLVNMTQGVNTQQQEEEETVAKIYTVVIDPGCGGTDSGNPGMGDTVEKTINLQVALKLQAMLEAKYPDVQVVMTRSDDSTLDTDQRVSIINTSNGDLAISLHCDYFAGSSERRGVTTYYRQSDGTEQTTGTEESGTEVKLSVSQMSQQIAQTLQTRAAEALETEDRGIAAESYDILIETNVPTVLMEMAYLTDTEDYNKITSESYQQSLAEAMADGIYQELQALYPNRAQEAAGQTAGEESSQSDSSVDHSSVNDSQGGADSVSEESSENSR